MKINNLKINYQKKGKGEFVFILHGWGSSCDVFNNAANLMAEKYCVVAPDLPGFGMSDAIKTPWSVDDYANFVIDFIKEFKAKKVILMGHSFGGKIIINIANKKDLPFEISKIILVGSAGIKPKRSIKTKIKIAMFKIAKVFISKKQVAKLRNKMGSYDYNNASPIMKETLVKSVNEDYTSILKNIKNETLLIWGKDDTATPIRDAKIMEKEIKNSGLVVLNGGHYVFLDSQFAFNKVISSFLEIK